MDASLVSRPPLDPSTVHKPDELPAPPVSSTKRRHHPSPSCSTSSPTPPSSVASKQPQPPFKLAAGQTLFRILCPGMRTGGVIGKGGITISQLREETGVKILIDDPVPGCEERVIFIGAESTKRDNNVRIDADRKDDNVDANGEELASSSSNSSIEEEASPAQQALIRVFEKMLKVDEESNGVSVESAGGKEKKEERDGAVGGPTPQGTVVCRLMAPSNQVGCVLGRGGKTVERIRHQSGAQVRVLPQDHVPVCACPGDGLIQITGNFSSVRKALLSVSSCLQDNFWAEAANSAPTKPSDIALHGTGTEAVGANYQMILEDDVVFKLLCPIEKIGSLIGKGGSVIRALQSETSASIKIADAVPDSDERVVIITARENSEQRHSPAQDAVILVHSRIAEIGFEKGTAVVARLLIHSQQIGCLLGKGGIIIADLRRLTGASIRIFLKEQAPRCGSQNDEVVQIVGSLQSVQDALLQITSRLRETILAAKPHLSSVTAAPCMPPYRETPPLFRSRHDLVSTGQYPSSVGLPHGMNSVAVPAQSFDPQSSFSHGVDLAGPTYSERVPYPCSGERLGNLPSFNRQTSPIRWPSQAVGSGNSREVANRVGGLACPIQSGSQAPATTTTTVEIPQSALSHVYGENNSNLDQIRQISGAKVIVKDPTPGVGEGLVVVSGTPDQIRAAQSLIQAFVLSEKTS